MSLKKDIALVELLSAAAKGTIADDPEQLKEYTDMVEHIDDFMEDLTSRDVSDKVCAGILIHLQLEVAKELSKLEAKL